jgi:hypothetical protein
VCAYLVRVGFKGERPDTAERVPSATESLDCLFDLKGLAGEDELACFAAKGDAG